MLCQTEIIYFNPFIFFLSPLCQNFFLSVSKYFVSLSLSNFSRLSLFVLVLEVEDLGVAGGGRGDESSFKELEDFIVDVGEFRLNLGQKAPPKEIGWSFDGVLIDVYGDQVLIAWVSFQWGFDQVGFVEIGF